MYIVTFFFTGKGKVVWGLRGLREGAQIGKRVVEQASNQAGRQDRQTDWQATYCGLSSHQIPSSGLGYVYVHPFQMLTYLLRYAYQVIYCHLLYTHRKTIIHDASFYHSLPFTINLLTHATRYHRYQVMYCLPFSQFYQCQC